jgi:hypothetical protein
MNIEKIKNLFILLVEKHIGEKFNQTEIISRAARIMYRYGFDYVIPKINLRIEYESRKLVLAFRPMTDVMNDEPDPWIEVRIA